MPPVTEPSATDVAAVAAHIDAAPVAEPVAPVAPPPTPPAPEPAPVGDPFETLFTPLPTEPAQPTEPTEPVVQPTQPTEVATPPAPVPAPVETPPQSFDDYMKSVVGDIDTPIALPDHNKIAPDDEAGIKNFFDDLVNTAVQRAEQAVAKKNAIQNSERQLWDGAFDKYGSLRTNKKMRDMVHNIRMGEFRRGVALTPTQAADQLLDAMKANYNRGVADNSVVTTIESTQPTGGGSGQPVPTSLDKENILTSVQSGGETALASYLDSEIKAGRM